MGLEGTSLQFLIRVVFSEFSIVNAEDYVEESGRLSNSQIPPSNKWSKVPLHLWRTWSVITPNSVNCFHTLPNNINFHQRSPFVIPVSDVVMMGPIKALPGELVVIRRDKESFAWDLQTRKTWTFVLDISDMQVPWREILWTPWGKQAGRYSSVLQGKAEYWLGFWLMFGFSACRTR